MVLLLVVTNRHQRDAMQAEWTGSIVSLVPHIHMECTGSLGRETPRGIGTIRQRLPARTVPSATSVPLNQICWPPTCGAAHAGTLSVSAADTSSPMFV